MTDSVQLHPDDEYNQKLVENVHPPEWVNPTPDGQYNLVVIGAGTAGLVTAAGAAGLGAKVALIEKHLMGGDCLNVGCVPSKALISAARRAAAIRDSQQFGINISGDVEVDFPAIMERLRRIRSEISHLDSASRFRNLGVDVYIGAAEFVDAQTLKVGDQTLKCTKAVICTGARAAKIPIPGLEEIDVLTNETLFSLTELPKRLAVIGAGPIGCEMAQSFARFGSEVTLFEAGSHILSREDADAARIVEQALMRDGINLLTDVKIQKMRQEEEEKILQYEQAGSMQEASVDAVLLGVGRQPNVEGLNLEAVGVQYDARKGVQVDDRLCTTNPHIFAAGDICSPYKFTHTADYQARIVIGNALFFGRGKASQLTVPWCTYTDPEIAHVGLYEQEAIDRGHKVQTFMQELADVDRALLDGEAEGFVKVHVKEGSDEILGATIVAAHAGDLVSEITLAMTNGIGLKGIGKTIHPYPTQADAIRKLGDAYNRTRLTPFIKNLFDKWLRFRR